MNNIRFSFEDLCAFFSRYPSRLMVGLIPTDGEAPEHVHQPHIIIKRNGVVEREYHTWAEINGDILLEVSPEGKPLSRYTPESLGDPRRPFSILVDIEKDLHPKERLQVDPRLCRARLYFRNGELYSTSQFTNVRFADVKTGQVCEHAPTETTEKVGLDVEIPEDGYATLRFFNGTEDFVFRSGSDYEVEVINLAQAITGQHFKYFYNIVRPQPEQLWTFAAGERLGLPMIGASGEAACLVGTFSSTIWEWLMGMLGGTES
ncbi:MAG TPA: hypothetical protein VJ810_00790 [Blastocatellia bacterium]|nr:hypothetical protein [Blastocatellia bacterium]